MPIKLNNTKNSLNYNNLCKIIKKHNTPIWIYEWEIIKKKIKLLKQFDIIRYAQKACSNINILKLMKKTGLKIDAVSYGEIKRALISNFKPKKDEIIFTSDSIDEDTLNIITKKKITVNAGSTNILKIIGKKKKRHKIWLRINPGFGNGHNKKTNTGGVNSKHGIWDIKKALILIKKYKLKLIGLHMHIGSGANYNHLLKMCKSMIKNIIKVNIDIKSISTGGGLPIPYYYKEKEINIKEYFKIWNNTRNYIASYIGHNITLEIEPGRFLVAQSGLLITKVNIIKKINNKKFVLIDAGFNDLIRPCMYGSYHHISVLKSKNSERNKEKYIICGPLCESGDIFTQDPKGNIKSRKLPKIKKGDYLIFHDTGAYGSTMSSNYNTRPLIKEILFKKGKAYIIRNNQSIKNILKLEQNCKKIKF
ncbi:diaminopimelate decarboxylase [Buchnera aphidicola (Mollitrichosiphum nigrofasciatum)]|uniref:diaminopimelate decarboxylase n=1 Tax=Buchnera aphidicola TaxID=9 RepID=UPI0031B7FFF1